MTTAPRARTLLALATALLLAGSLVGPAAAAERRTPPVAVTGSNTAFSPNGDGSKDVGVVTYRLAKPGAVTVTIRRGGVPVVTKKLGRQSKGTKTFRWNGKRAGKVVQDGTYVVTVASRGGRARTPLVVDARYSRALLDTGTLELSSDKVYPYASAIKDEVSGLYADTKPFAATSPTEWQVLDPSGRVVRSGSMERLFVSVEGREADCLCSRMKWDARDAAGDAMPVGTYRVRLLSRDAAGNPRFFDATQSVTVSRKELVMSSSTRTITMAEAQARDPFAGSTANGIPFFYCGGSTPSERFPGGRTFRSTGTTYSTPDGHCINLSGWQAPVEGRRTPYDTYSVTATGGPTVAGAPDAGTLGSNFGTDAVMTGGEPATTRAPFARASTTPPGLGASAITWSFEIDKGQSYDLTGFTLTTNQYVEAS